MPKNQNQNEQWMLLVLLLKEIASQKGLSINEISTRTEIAQSHVSRFFSCKFEPKLSSFLTFSKAIGVNFFFEDKESKTDLNQAMERAMEALGRRIEKDKSRLN